MIINTSILISCKLDETKGSALKMLDDLKLTSNERCILFRFEQEILNKLKFRINITTPCDILEWIVRCYVLCFSKNVSEKFNAITGKLLFDNQILELSNSILFLLYGNDLALEILFGQSITDENEFPFRNNFFSISIGIVCASVLYFSLQTFGFEQSKKRCSFLFDWAKLLLNSASSSNNNQQQQQFRNEFKILIAKFSKMILDWTKLLVNENDQEKMMNQLIDDLV